MTKVGSKVTTTHEEHKTDEADYGSAGELPEGIEGGIARLVDCKFDTYKSGNNEGEYFFYAAAIVQSPKEHNGIRIEGLRTSIMEPLCETPGRRRESLEDHYLWVLNELKKLGLDMEDVSTEELETIVGVLKEEGPYIRFRTWKGKPTKEFPDPRVNHEWKGVCEWDEEEEEDEAVVDETEEEEEEEDEVADEEEGEIDYDELATMADEGDEGAATAITEAADDQGIDPNEYETWKDVVAEFNTEDEEEEEAEEEEEDDDEEDEIEAPEKEDVYLYKPPKARKPVECEVTAVFAGKRTCNLKNTNDGKVYKGVAWDKLIQD